MLSSLAALALALCAHPPGQEAPRLQKTGAALAVDPLGRGTWVVDAENDAVTLISDDGSRQVHPVGGWPDQLVVTECGNVWVSLREGGIAELDGQRPGQLRRITLPGEPRALALDERARSLYVALEGAREVVRVDTHHLEVVARLQLLDAPGPLALTPEGLAVLGRRTGQVHVVDRNLGGALRTITLELPGRATRHGYALVAEGPDLVVVYGTVDTGRSGRFDFDDRDGYGGDAKPLELRLAVLRDGVLVRHLPISRSTFSLPGEPTAAAYRDGVLMVADRGSRSLFVVSVDLPLLRTGATIALRAGHGLSGVVADGAGGWLALSAIDRNLLSFRLPPDALRRAREPFSDGLLIMGSRAGISSIGPRAAFGGLGIGGLGTKGWGSFEPDETPAPRPDLVALATLLDGSRASSPPAPPPWLSRRPLPRERARWQATLASLGPGRWDPELRRGARLFHDASHEPTTTRGITCAGCHPDGRSDGLVWRRAGEDVRTPVLAGRLGDEGPFNWFGTEATLTDNIHSTVERLDGMGLTDRDARALARFLRLGLRPPPRVPVDSEEDVRAGERVFHSAAAGCDSCHPSDGRFTDGLRHRFDRRSRPRSTAARYGVLTPSLLHLGHSERFLHDGRARSLEELIATNGERMGATHHLDADERRALASYLRSL